MLKSEGGKKNGVQCFILRSCDQDGGWSSIYTGRYLCARISVLMASCGALVFLVHTDIFNTVLKIL